MNPESETLMLCKKVKMLCIRTNLVQPVFVGRSFVSSLPALLVLPEGVEAPFGGPTITPLAFIVSLKRKK